MNKWKVLRLLMLAVVFSLHACLEEDDVVEPESTILGSWIVQYSFFDGIKEDYGHSCSTKKDYIEFKAGGELKALTYEDDCSVEEDIGTYSMTGDKVTLRSEDIGTVTYTFKVTGNTMTWEKPGEVTTLARK